MKKRALVTMIALATVLFLVLGGGCSLFHKEAPGDPAEKEADPEEAKDDDKGPGNAADSGENPREDEEDAEERTVKITLYFGDKKAIESGDPTELGYVTPVVRELPHTTAVLRLALQELIRGPLPGEGDLVRTVPATTKILDVKVEDGIAYIDFSSELIADSPGGTLGGAYLIQSLIYTATEFPTVKTVLVTVKGETYSDGHYIWDNPMGRKDHDLAK